jgi:hypothetical protein
MVVFNNALAGAAGSGGAAGYEIERSLRFNAPDGAYLSKNFGSAGNLNAWTFSFWVKRSKLDVNEILFGYLDGGATNGQFLRYLSGNIIDFSQIQSGSYTARLITDQGFRDPSAWAHMVVVWDSSNGTADSRHRIYINGVEVDQFSTRTNPSPSLNSLINTAVEHGIGTYGTFRGVYLSAYLADVHFLDGIAVSDATDFGEFDATTGAWNPIEYVGTFPGNSFHLDFADNSSTTNGSNVGIGKDVSGNGNYWDSNNIIPVGLSSPESDVITSVTTGPTYSSSTYFSFGGSATYNPTTAAQLFAPGSAVAGISLYNNTSDSLTWTPPTSIPFTTLEVIFYKDGGYFYVNGTDVTSQINNRSTSYQTITGISSPLSSIGFTGSGGGQGWYGLKINGVKVTDNQPTLTLSTNQNLTNFSVGDAVKQDDLAASGVVFSVNVGSNTMTIGSSTGTWSANTNNYVVGPDTLSDTDSLRDSPTNGDTADDTGLGNEVPGNYATLNPLDKAAVTTLANGNLDYSTTGAGGVRSTIGMSSGKYYAEVTVGHVSLTVGIAAGGTALNNYLGANAGEYGYGQNGYKLSSTTQVPYGDAFTTGDVIGIAFDADAGDLYFYKNGTIQASGTPAFSGLTNNTYFFAISNNVATNTCNANFGQRAFAYSAPSGFKALCTANLDDPTIADGSTAFEVITYQGNGGTQTLPNTDSTTSPQDPLKFSPDLMWIKNRSSAYHHALYDTIRGATKMLSSSETAAEITYSSVTSQTADFEISGAESRVNENNLTYVAWTWDAGSSTVSNTDGSITSSVRANPSAGFSIVGYTGAGSAATVGHGLGVTPSLVICKDRTAADAWMVWFTGFTSNEYMYLNSTAAKGSYSGTWGSTPTSTVFGVSDQSMNQSGNNFIAYCFAPVESYSAFGSYTGNGSNDGPFVYTGFRPKFLLFKSATIAEQWNIRDAGRDTYNPAGSRLFPNLSNAESTSNNIDLLSNGFKVRGNSNQENASGETYIWAAFAESPFAYARAR